MKHKLLLFLACFTFLFACKKASTVTDRPTVDCSRQAFKDSMSLIDKAIIRQYAADSSIVIDSTATGLFYAIADSGTGTTFPSLNSTITVKYVGYLVNGTIFDRVGNVGLSGKLGQLILGWQYGIPKLKKGGKIKLLVPSALGYGCQTVGAIPANSVTIFDVELVDFI